MKPKKPPSFYISHQDLQDNIMALLTGLGIPASVTDASRCWDSRGKVARSKVRTGWPDIIGCIPPRGQLLAIEVKAGKDRVRPCQRLMLERLWKAGAAVFVARSIDPLHRWLERGLEVARMES